MKNLIFLIGLFLTFNIFAAAQVAQGGSYTLDQSVIAAGGGEAVGGSFTLTGTFGQALAGAGSNGGSYTIKSGFWTGLPVAPTAAALVIEGRILTAGGQGIRNVSIAVTDSNGMTRAVSSGSFGYYKFDNLPGGSVYTISVQSKKYQFDQSSQIVFLLDNIGDLNFIALPD